MSSQAIEQHAPAPQQEERPATRRSWAFFVIYGLATLPVGVASIAVNALLLPEQVAMLHPTDEKGIFSILIIGGALASTLANPLAGYMLDRLRRFSWACQVALLIGVLIIIIGLLTLRRAPNFDTLFIGESLTQFGVGVLLGSLSAYLPGIAPTQRATASAISGMAPLIGGVIGQALAAPTAVVNAYLLLLGVSVGLALFGLLLREHRSPSHQERQQKTLITKNFVWTWISRFLFYFIFTSVINYSSYYIRSLLPFPLAICPSCVAEAEQAFFLTLTVSLVISSLICGILSDRWQVRRPFTIGSGIVLVAVLIALALNTNVSLVLPLTALFGIASGAFVSSDLAVAVAVLPSTKNWARDLGWMNTCIYLPMIVSPIVSSFVLHSGSFSLLYSVLAGIAILVAMSMGLVKTQ